MVRLRMLVSTICGVSQHFQVLGSFHHLWGGYHVINSAMAMVCKTGVLPRQVSCYSAVEDAVAGGAAQPQQLLVPPAGCRHVPVLPGLRRRAGVLKLWDLQSITQRCAVYRNLPLLQYGH